MKQRTIDFLNESGVPFDLFEHEPVHTMEECAALDCSQGASHAKNLFLCNRQGTRFYLLLVEAHKAFKTSEFSKAMGISRVSFANEAQLMDKLSLSSGAVGPLALLNDASREVTLVIDADLKGAPRVAFHPNDNAASVFLAMDDMEKCLRKLGYEPVYLELKGIG